MIKGDDIKKITTAPLLCSLLLAVCVSGAPSVAASKYDACTTEAGSQMAPVLDLAGSLGQAEYTRDTLRDKIKAVRDMGFRRLYTVVDLPGYPQFSEPETAPALGSIKLKNIQALGGDSNAALARICRELDMEAIAIFKPYENGGMLSVPSGVTVRESGFIEETVGGRHLFFDSFVNKHPEMRVRRRDDYDADDYKLPITKIELEFMLDQYTDPSVRATNLSSRIPDYAAGRPRINLWVSRDNGEYSLWQGGFSYDYKIEQRDIRDANGIVLGKGKRCNVLTIAGINIGEEYPCVAVTLGDSRDMRLIPYSMIRWFSGDKELKLTAATYVRTLSETLNRSGQWTNQSLPSYGNVNLTGVTVSANGTVTVKTNHSPMTWKDHAVSRFYETGFVFSWYGVGHNGDGWKSTAMLGLARGKKPYIGGSLCEAYPEVRQYWLDTVKHLLDIGYAGVDVRLQSHSAMIMDYMNYGFNEPLVKKYKELYGTDLNTIPMTPEVYLRLMRMRGDYFTLFLEDAARLIHSRGARLLVHLKDAHEKPACDSNWNQLCHWTMPKIALDWKRCVELAGEITIKDYYYKKYNPNLAGKTKDYAASLGKRVWVHCYYAQGDAYDETFLRNIEKDGRIKGILLYDVWYDFMKDTPVMLEKFKYKDRGAR
jgi:hypothetical protein